MTTSYCHLDAAERAVIQLRLLQGLSQRRIAQEFDRSPSTISRELGTTSREVKFIRFSIIILAVFILSGCGTVTNWGSRPDFSKISPGMSQSQVVTVLGKPEDISANRRTTYLTYTYAPWYDHNGADGNKEYYFVRLVNNSVDSYGHRGDFDSTKPPERTININMDQR